MIIYLDKNKFRFSSELMILIGLLNEYPKEKIKQFINHNNQSRYYPLLELCKKNIQYTENIKKSNICILPYKFNGILDIYFNKLVKLCNKNNKILLCFYNDDNDITFNLPKNVILFRTSFYKSKQLINEKALTVFSADYFKNYYLKKPKLSIGYCGHILYGRQKYINILNNSNIKCNFILRNGMWAPRIDSNKAVLDFYKNIENNIFIFCYRGNGNFSYRFYQILMMGRIPILINTDCVFPFENKYNLNDLGIIIDEKDLLNNKKNLINEIINYYNNTDLLKIQKQNRKIWEEYFSPLGFSKYLIEEYS